MAKISGKAGYVMYGGNTIAELTEWAITGVSMAVIKKDPAFADTVVEKIADGVVEPGTISFRGNYDPDDSTGQALLSTACQAGVGIYNLYLYAAAATWWHVGTGGTIIVTKADSVTLPRSGMGVIDFAGEVEGAAMEQEGTGA